MFFLKKIVRKIVFGIYKIAVFPMAVIFDKNYLAEDVPLAKISHHKKWMPYVAEFANKKGMKVLEIGSRWVTGDYFKPYFSEADYVGFDFYPGKNVDVVGDAHKLSTYFKKDEKFDVIYSSAVFEHLAMPWLAALEISKLLKVGGLYTLKHIFLLHRMKGRGIFSNTVIWR
jgi:ubiquinone/menaquinone biosynthesis C-methylase UbiE